MKIYFKSALLPVLVLSLFLTSCLKDDDYDDRLIQSTRPGGNQKVVGIGLTATATTNFLQYSLNASNKDTTFALVPVTIASTAAEEDVRVIVVQNPALIGEYNNNNGTIKENAPTSVYTITNAAATGGGYIVTIPKGQSTGYIEIKINPSNFLGHDYALGFQISKVENSGYLVSRNVSSGVAAIGIKNKYDGVYELTGTFNDLLAPANNPSPGDPFPYEIHLITTGATSNVMYIPGGGFFHLIAGGSVYGEFDPIFTFNASDKIISVTNYYGDPSPTRFRSAEIDPTGANEFTADRNIDVKYFMRQGGVLKTTFDEHLEYLGERP